MQRFQIARPRGIADVLRTFEHGEIDHAPALFLAENGGLLRLVTQRLQPRHDPPQPRLARGDRRGDVVHLAGGIDLPARPDAEQKPPPLQRPHQIEAARQGRIQRRRDLGQSERPLLPRKQLEDIQRAAG